MALLRCDGSIQYNINGVTYIRKRNANGDMTDIKSAKKRKFVIDKSKLAKRTLRKLERLEEKLLMRKQIEKYLRGR